MKRRKIKALMCLLLSIAWLLTFCDSPRKAFADGTADAVYAAAATKSAYFFTEKSGNSALFAVPYTYCVEILGDDGDWYKVKYADDAGIYKAMYGYCLKKDFNLLSYKPEVIWLYKEITVKFVADDGSSSLPVLGELEVSAAFYGAYYAGATAYSYVCCEGSFGYITGANDDYPLNPSLTQPDDNGRANEINDGANVTVIAVIIVALAAAAIIILAITSKRRERIGRL